MLAVEYGVVDEEEFVYSPVGMTRDEAIRMACALGEGHTPMRRTCEAWEPFDTGVIDPCGPRVLPAARHE